MKNYICPGKTKPFTAAANILSGAPVVIGDTVGISATDVASGAVGEASLEGVYSVPKKSADVIADGVKVYWDATLGEATITASTNKVLGYAYEAAGAAVTTLKAKLGR